MSSGPELQAFAYPRPNRWLAFRRRQRRRTQRPRNRSSGGPEAGPTFPPDVTDWAFNTGPVGQRGGCRKADARHGPSRPADLTIGPTGAPAAAISADGRRIPWPPRTRPPRPPPRSRGHGLSGWLRPPTTAWPRWRSQRPALRWPEGERTAATCRRLGRTWTRARRLPGRGGHWERGGGQRRCSLVPRVTQSFQTLVDGAGKLSSRHEPAERRPVGQPG